MAGLVSTALAAAIDRDVRRRGRTELRGGVPVPSDTCFGWEDRIPVPAVPLGSWQYADGVLSREFEVGGRASLVTYSDETVGDDVILVLVAKGR